MHARLERLVAAGDEAAELRAVLLQQRQVQRLLGGEVAIEDGLGDLGGGRDVLEAGPGVAALGEQARGLREDDGPALLGGSRRRRGGRAMATGRVT